MACLSGHARIHLVLGHLPILVQPGRPRPAYIAPVRRSGLLGESYPLPSDIVIPSRARSAREALTIRVLIAVGCIVLTTLVVWWERDGYRDGGQNDPLSPLDALYYATVTLSTTGYGDITPVSDMARITNIVLITPLRFLFLIVLVGTTIEVLTQTARQRSRVARWRRTMKDHTIVIGFGVKGKAALRSLLSHGMNPRELVVIAADRQPVADATRAGVVGVVGDARDDQVLRDAGVPTAKRVIIAANEDDTAIMITLRVRAMAPDTTIVAAARETSSAELLRQSGADRVITHAESAGSLMALSLVSGNVGELIEDLMDTGRGLEVAERPITREELGLAPADVQSEGELVLAVVRDGVLTRFDEGRVRVFQHGDRVVVIRRAAVDLDDLGRPDRTRFPSPGGHGAQEPGPRPT